jgi:hypothetical protein
MADPERIADLNRTLEGIYDDYRTILLNAKYNGARLGRVRRWNRILEFIIAIGASGSGIAGFTLWKSDYGQFVWGAISAAAIIVSIIKPILNLGHDIEEHSQLWAEYSTLNARCRNAVRAIDSNRSRLAETGELPKNISDEVEDIRSKMVELAPRGDQNPSQKRLEALQTQVNAEIPPATLWVVPLATEGQKDV